MQMQQRCIANNPIPISSKNLQKGVDLRNAVKLVAHSMIRLLSWRPVTAYTYIILSISIGCLYITIVIVIVIVIVTGPGTRFA